MNCLTGTWRALCASRVQRCAQSVARLIHSSQYLSDDDVRPTTPWVRQVISGVDLMRHPKYNKGLAFSEEERDKMYLRGLLPPAVLSQEVQVERALLNLRSRNTDLDRFTYLQNLQERNERLFYRLLTDHFAELLHVVHVPTVLEACQRYGLMFRSLPRGLFLTYNEKGGVYQTLKNWPERRVKLIVLTDGEQVGRAGDLGVHSINAAISKIALISAAGCVAPNVCMPICLDVGTDNADLLRSPFYVGNKHRRLRGETYTELMDEILEAVKGRFGNTAMLVLDDMSYDNVNQLMGQYRGEFPCYSDEYQGLPATVLAALLASQRKTNVPLSEHTYVIAGDGPHGACIAELLATAIGKQTGETLLDARRRIWLLDSNGLIVRSRPDADEFPDYVLPYCHDAPSVPDLITAVITLKPTVLIGCNSPKSKHAQTFSRDVCREMALSCPTPIIFALSPAPECSSQEVYRWTEGKCVFASRDHLESRVRLPSGTELNPSYLHSIYITAGLALGTLASRSTRIREEQLIAAAEVVASHVTPEELERGSLLPPLSDISNLSCNVAKAVASVAYDTGIATELPRPVDLAALIDRIAFDPRYPMYR